MNIEITLNDEDGHPALLIKNCHQEDLISISLINDTDDFNRVVVIEQLKMAIRKITAK